MSSPGSRTQYSVLSGRYSHQTVMIQHSPTNSCGSGLNITILLFGKNLAVRALDHTQLTYKIQRSKGLKQETQLDLPAELFFCSRAVSTLAMPPTPNNHELGFALPL